MSLEFITNNLEALADDLSLGQIREHFLNLALDQNEFNSKKRKNEFMGTVISNSQTADFPQAAAAGHIIGVKIRLDDAQGEYLPEYGRSGYTKKQQKIILSCHGTSYSQAPLDDNNGERVPAFGERVVCRYAKESPDFYGRMRDLRYQYPTSGKAPKYITDTDVKNNNFGKNKLSDLTATPSKEVIAQIDEELVVVFGDSQMQPSRPDPTMGMVLEKQFKNAYRIGNHSWTAETWLYGTKGGSAFAGSFHAEEKKKLENQLKKKPALVIIGLGGNGVSSGGLFEKELITWVRGYAPKASIIWIGPPPPASDREFKTRLESRRKLNEKLLKNIGTLVTSFVNPYSSKGKVKKTVDFRQVIATIDFSKGYECGGDTCDGIHIKGKYATAMLEGLGMIK